MENKDKRIQDLKNILDEEDLWTDEQQRDNYLIGNDQRYGRFLTENEESERFFLKILLKDTPENRKSFHREVMVTDWLHNSADIPAQEVYTYNPGLNNLMPYAVFEVLPKANQKNFIEKPGELVLGSGIAKKVVEHIDEIHKVEIPDYIKNVLQERDVLDSFRGFYDDVFSILDKIIDSPGKSDEEIFPPSLENDLLNTITNPEGETFHYCLEKELLVTDLKVDILDMVMSKNEIIDSSSPYDRLILVHGDLSPMNFCDNKGRTQFLDWEWAACAKNETLAWIYDYGNLYSRAWNDPVFRKELDKAVLDLKGDEYGKAILSLGKLRSACMHLGFFLNYPIEKQLLPKEKQRREVAKQNIIDAFE